MARPLTPAPTTTTSACLLMGGSLCCPRAHLDRDRVRRARARDEPGFVSISTRKGSPAPCCSTTTTSSTTPASRSSRRNGRLHSSWRRGGAAMLVPRLEVEHARSATGIERDRPLRRVSGHPTRGGGARASCSTDMGIAVGSAPTRTATRGSSATGARALGAGGRRGRPRRRVRRGADGGQVGGRDRPHPREREVGEPRAPPAPAVHARRPDGDGGDAARLRRGDDGDAPDARPALPRPEPAHRTGRTPGTAARSAAAAAIPHALANNVVFQPGDILVTGASAADVGLPLGARADDGDRRTDGRAAADVRPHGRGPGHSRSTRSSPALAAATSISPSARTSTSTT